MSSLIPILVITALIILYILSKPKEPFRRFSPFSTLAYTGGKPSIEMCRDRQLVSDTIGLAEWCRRNGATAY